MGRSLLTYINEQYQKYDTVNNTSLMFKPGDLVRVITPFQDYCGFDVDNTYGVVTRNTHGYLGVIALVISGTEEDGATYNEMGFDPRDLIIHVDERQKRKEEKKCHYVDNFLRDSEFFSTKGLEFVNIFSYRWLLRVDLITPPNKYFKEEEIPHKPFKQLEKYLGFSIIRIKSGYNTYTF